MIKYGEVVKSDQVVDLQKENEEEGKVDALAVFRKSVIENATGKKEDSQENK